MMEWTVGYYQSAKDGDVTMLNPDGMKKFYAVYNTVKSTVGKGAKVTYGINDPFVGHGAIRIEGKKISFKNTKLLMEAAKLASNFEVYPLANGKVRMAFAFSKLTLR